MRRETTFILCVAAAAIAVAQPFSADGPRDQGRARSQSAANTLTTDERADGRRLLFDGKTAAGWRGYREQTLPSGWQAIDGA